MQHKRALSGSGIEHDCREVFAVNHAVVRSKVGVLGVDVDLLQRAAENAAQIHDADVCAYGDSCHAVSFSRIVFVPRDVRSERVCFKRGAKHNGTVRFVGLACRRINLNLRQICAVAESVLAQRNKIFGKRNFSQSRAAVESARCDFELHRLSVSEKLNRSQIGTVPESV